MFNTEDLQESEKSPFLGPAYFDSRRVAQNIMDKFEADNFKPLLEKFSENFADVIRKDMENYILTDVECNIQGEMWRMVDNCVEALLTGKGWALQRYALTDKFDGPVIREAILRHASEELKGQRILDLEKQIESLKKDLKNRDRY